MKVADIKKLIDVDKFFQDVEQTRKEFRCSYVESIIHCCEQQKIEPEMAATLIRSNPTLKKKVQSCSEGLRLIQIQ